MKHVIVVLLSVFFVMSANQAQASCREAWTKAKQGARTDLRCRREARSIIRNFAIQLRECRAFRKMKQACRKAKRAAVRICRAARRARNRAQRAGRRSTRRATKKLSRKERRKARKAARAQRKQQKRASRALMRSCTGAAQKAKIMCKEEARLSDAFLNQCKPARGKTWAAVKNTGHCFKKHFAKPVFVCLRELWKKTIGL